MRKNPYLCQEQNPGYQNHNQLLRFVTHMHKCILLNLTSSGYLAFRSTIWSPALQGKKLVMKFPSPSYETQEHVDLAVVCTCLCCHIWKAAAYELVDEQMESDVSSCIHTSSNTKPTTTWTWSSIMPTISKTTSQKKFTSMIKHKIINHTGKRHHINGLEITFNQVVAT